MASEGWGGRGEDLRVVLREVDIDVDGKCTRRVVYIRGRECERVLSEIWFCAKQEGAIPARVWKACTQVLH